jgi:hypothetical protein
VRIVAQALARPGGGVTDLRAGHPVQRWLTYGDISAVWRDRPIRRNQPITSNFRMARLGLEPRTDGL